MELVLFEKITPKIATITLNDPDNLNAMSEEMAKQFKIVCDSLRTNDQGLRVLILKGSGKAFSAGGHIEMLLNKTKLSPEENEAIMLLFYNSFLSIREIGIPVIAQIHGSAVGAGLCLASACDIRIASKDAKLGFTFTKLGLHPGMGATFLLSEIVGHAKATELLLTAKLISADEALEIGLVSSLTESGDLASKALEIATQITSCGKLATNTLLKNLRSKPQNLNDALSREANAQSQNYASKEFYEGVIALKEKRKPNFD